MPSMDRAGRHDANPFRSGHAAVKRQMESGFDLDELASAIARAERRVEELTSGPHGFKATAGLVERFDTEFNPDS